MDEHVDAIVQEANHRYHNDAEFHTIVDTAVNASIAVRDRVFVFFMQGDEQHARSLMTDAAAIALVLQEHIDDD